MCGFLGQYSTQQTPKSEFLTNLAIAQHRGPDRSGYWQGEGIQLGFNRLAIVDLTEAGHQPMLSRSGDWAVVFNGEIYNHQELRKAFTSYPFKGHSDTETLVASLEAHGFEETVKKLIGMFAIAAWHKPTKTLYATRDSVGIKPFFYSNTAENLWFASQFDQVIKGLGEEKVTLYPEGVQDYMQFGYMQAPNTIYKEIKQLLPGEMLRANAAGLHLKRIIEYPRQKRVGTHKDTDSGALDAYNELFSKVVKEQLNADVPISTFLSSGIDSTLVTAFASKSKPDLTAYTIGVSNSKTDERDLAFKYAEALKIKNKQEELEKSDFLEVLDDHFQKLGEPFADYSSIPTYLICQKARQNSTVMLSGDGGDELFWGYNRLFHLTNVYPLFSIKNRKIRKIYHKLFGSIKTKLAAPFEFKRPEEMVINVHTHLKADVVPKTHNPAETKGIYRFTGKSKIDFRDWLRYNEFYAHMQRVLIKVDRMSMANSLEVRVPLLDQRVVDFAWSLQSDFAMNDDRTLKPFLKKALYQFIPQDLINQKKKGFTIPLSEWLRGELEADVREHLLNKEIYGAEHLDVDAIRNYVKGYYAHKHNNEWGMWILYAWQKWAISQGFVNKN